MKVGNLHLSTLIVLVLVCTLGACSHDEPEGYDWVDGKTFVNVNISSTSSDGTRAANDFVYGSDEEHEVESARFLFYDDKGVFVGEASIWKGGTPSTGSDSNVEYWGKSTLMLTGLSRNDFPTNLVTILNAPANFHVGSTLEKLYQELSGGYLNEHGKFIMTTSSYDHTADSNPYYCVTTIAKENFMSTAEAAVASSNCVDVYVDRLAAKVQVSLNISATTNPRVQVGNVDDLYQIDDFTFIGLSEMTTTGYIRLLGWGLNCTYPDSYCFKNINTGWSFDNFEWSAPGLYRSYWAMSPNYGDATCYYPPYYIKNDANVDALTYVPASALTHNFTDNNVAYCNENTNTAAIINANYPASLTSVTILAQLYLEDGRPIDNNLVRYHGMFFTQDAFIDYVIGSLRALGQYKMNYQHNGHDLELGHFKLVSVESPDRRGLKNNGRVMVQLADDKTEGWTDMTTGKAVSAETINSELASFVDMEEYDAICYKDGLMYYNIPLEHLNSTADNITGTTVKVAEGHYGVVRNHCYQVTLTAITGLGVGIFDQEEPIVPQLTTSNYYHVGARINILSWKTLSQLVVI